MGYQMNIKNSMLLWAFFLLFSCNGTAEEIEILPLDVVSYELLVQNDPETVRTLVNALHEKGIVGVREIPGYSEKLQKFVESSRSFCSLPDSVKESYAPNHDLGEMFLGYEKGKEKFKRPDGKWVVDDLKISYYAYVPENRENKWPLEVDLKTAFQDLGMVMAETGEKVMEKINLIGSSTGIFITDTPKVGRMLYYQKNADTCAVNPFWCGAHYDHGMFTAITPATYFVEGEQVAEPREAGLFVKIEGKFKKIQADPSILMFQTGEFGQLVTHDAIRATEHRVHKAQDSHIERYAMALFFNAPMNTVIHSFSKLTQDARYGGMTGDPCTYQHWHEESFKRYIVKDSQ
jgi:isopenicillin N synthase-like dioxygenase